MWIIYLISMFLMLHFLYVIKVKSYEDSNYEHQCKGTRFIFIIGVIISLIPITNTIISVIFWAELIKLLKYGEVYYKPGRVLNFLNKKW